MQLLPNGNDAKDKAAPSTTAKAKACNYCQANPNGHGFKAKQLQWAHSQGQDMQQPRRRHVPICTLPRPMLVAMGTMPKPRQACYLGQGSPHWHIAKAKACSSQGQGLQQKGRRHNAIGTLPGLRKVAMGTMPRPRHACCHGQGSPIGTQPRPRQPHGHTTKDKASLLPWPRPRHAVMATLPSPRHVAIGIMPRPRQPHWVHYQAHGIHAAKAKAHHHGHAAKARVALRAHSQGQGKHPRLC